jgi:hypothetical protein
MASLERLVCVWNGAPGGTGISTFYSSTGGMVSSAFKDAIRGAFNTIAGWIPNYITITIPGSGDVIDDATGEITGAWSGETTEVVTGTSSWAHPSPAGALVQYHTDGIVNGRNVRGRLFIVPLGGNPYGSNGSLLPATITALGTAFNNAATASSSVQRIWSRPVDAEHATPSSPVRAGSSHTVISATCRSAPAVLKGRRDA